MPKPYPPSTSTEEEVVLALPDAGFRIDRWSSYSFNSHFLSATDAFHFEIGESELDEGVAEALYPGAHVQLWVGGNIQGDGYIDQLRIDRGRHSGRVYHLIGRDRMGQVVDSVADPTLVFKEGATLADVLKELFKPFGWSSDEQFIIDNDANRDAKTGGIRGGKYSKGKKHFGQELKNYVCHQLKPYNHEGVFHFASRIAQRFGLWIWLSADGEQVIVAKPEFDQEATYQLVRDDKGNSNVEEGGVTYDVADQPSVIVADGFSGGAEFGKGRIKAYCINPYTGVDEQGFALDEITQLIASKFPDASQVDFVTQPTKRKFRAAKVRPAFLHDDESKTLEQLENFVRREMSLLLRKSVVCHYRVSGHGQVLNGIVVPWETDTLVDVQDAEGGISENMYVLSRTFNKQRGSTGTSTDLELIRLHSIQF